MLVRTSCDGLMKPTYVLLKKERTNILRLIVQILLMKLAPEHTRCELGHDTAFYVNLTAYLLNHVNRNIKYINQDQLQINRVNEVEADLLVSSRSCRT